MGVGVIEDCTVLQLKSFAGQSLSDLLRTDLQDRCEDKRLAGGVELSLAQAHTHTKL